MRHDRRYQRVPLTVSAAVLVVIGAGGAVASGPGTAHAASRSAVPSLSRLSSLKNYTFTTTSTNAGYAFKLTGAVNGPENWETHAISPLRVVTYDVGGRGYTVALGQVRSVSFATPSGSQQLDGEFSAAQALVGFTHVAGIVLTTPGACRVAGVNGTTYRLVTEKSAASLLVESATACVATGTGALLSLESGVPSGSAATAIHLRGATTVFTVDSVGGVRPFRAPRLTPSTTVARAPVTSLPAASLPAGFPPQVPRPPGEIVSGVRISATKWYLQMKESSAAAIDDFARALTASGFTMKSRSNSSLEKVDLLDKGTLQVMLQQMSLPGESVLLMVTVDRSS
ncbi:MAG: hypothetical protein HIU57_09715 [Acidobacteria bacterium]|nr:hypothetical protein [Acidobacteriota bacterium]